MNKMLTTEQHALNAYIKQENDKFEANCKARGATFWCVNALTADDLTHYGVYNVEQYKEWSEENARLCDEKEERKNSYIW